MHDPSPVTDASQMSDPPTNFQRPASTLCWPYGWLVTPRWSIPALETMSLKSYMLEATHSQAQGLVFVLKIFSLYTFSSILLGFLVECISVLSSFLAMLSASDSSSVLCVLLFQALRCEAPPRHRSLHCPCSTLAKPQSWSNPFPFLLHSQSELTCNAGEKPQSSANWSSTNTKSLGLAEPSTLCTTSLEFSHLAFFISPPLHLSLPT